MKSLNRLSLGAMALVLLAGCAADRHHRDGMELLRQGQPQPGLTKLQQAVDEEPGNARFRLDLAVERERELNQLWARAAREWQTGRLEKAEELCRQMLQLDAVNERALQGLDGIQRDRRHAELLTAARQKLDSGDAEGALTLAAPVGQENPANGGWKALQQDAQQARLREQHVQPVLQTAGQKPVSLRFADASLRMVFDAIARSSGLNILFDKDVRPDLRTSINLNQAAVEDAIELLLQTNQLQKKVLNSNTLLIYPDTPDKVRDYGELIVRSFYLDNVEAKQAESLLKTVLKLKDVYVDERLNLLVLRDKPETIRLAEKLIAIQDVQEPEVMLELAVMEVQRSRLTELGVDWPDQLSVAPLSRTGGPTLSLSDLGALNSDRIRVGVGSALVNLRRELTDSNILANPRIRIRNKERAKVLIGDKVPVLTTTSTSTGFVAENVQYLDVGLKLDAEPTVYLQNEVAIKVGLEVSSITKEITTANGALIYQIGTRSAETTLRLKDGETQILAGLINDEDRASAQRVPGLGDLPLLNRLFGSKRGSRSKTEIVLSITPRVIRNIRRADATAGEFWSGTETALRTRPLTIQPPASQGSLSGTGESAGAPGAPAGSAVAGNMPLPVPTKISLAWRGPTEVKVGQEFTLDLRVNSDGGLRAMPLQLQADPAAFDIVKVQEGGFFRQPDSEASFNSNTDKSTGKIFIGTASSGSNGVRGEGSVLTVTLRAHTAKSPARVEVLSATPLAGEGLAVEPTLPIPLQIKVLE